MTLLQAIILGIVQGLTEFIPVSSTAHLLLTQTLLRIDPNQAGVFAFNVLVQLGTLAALIVYFRADLWAIGRAWLMGIVRRRPLDDPQARLGWYLLLGTVPALVAGVVFKPLVEWLFRNAVIEAVIRLALTVVLLIVAELAGKRTRSFAQLGWKDAWWVGCAQILAVFPGASRSGSTLAGGMVRHLDRPAAARFAFLLSVPVMAAAGIYEMLDLLHTPNLSVLLPPILLGVAVAALVGYLAIRWLLSYLTKHSLYDFAIYCTVLGIVTVIAWSIWH